MCHSVPKLLLINILKSKFRLKWNEMKWNEIKLN